MKPSLLVKVANFPENHKTFVSLARLAMCANVFDRDHPLVSPISSMERSTTLAWSWLGYPSRLVALIAESILHVRNASVDFRKMVLSIGTQTATPIKISPTMHPSISYA